MIGVYEGFHIVVGPLIQTAELFPLLGSTSVIYEILLYGAPTGYPDLAPAAFI